MHLKTKNGVNSDLELDFAHFKLKFLILTNKVRFSRLNTKYSKTNEVTKTPPKPKRREKRTNLTKICNGFTLFALKTKTRITKITM